MGVQSLSIEDLLRNYVFPVQQPLRSQNLHSFKAMLLYLSSTLHGTLSNSEFASFINIFLSGIVHSLGLKISKILVSIYC